MKDCMFLIKFALIKKDCEIVHAQIYLRLPQSFNPFPTLKYYVKNIQVRKQKIVTKNQLLLYMLKISKSSNKK